MADLSENAQWLLSFYRSSEINGALFFGRVARTIRGPLAVDVTHHFADEAAHASLWTRCLTDLDVQPIKVGKAYQDQYLTAIGVPANLMEVMAITQVFERRVIGQYRRHLRHERTHPAVRAVLQRIMLDERWHIAYVSEALRAMEDRYGADAIADTLRRFAAADEEVYAKTLAEYAERLDFLIDPAS
jgi:bacterioferritin (cytochrome b1)